MEEQHFGAGRAGGDPARETGRPGLRPPPGFEHLARGQVLEAGEGSAAPAPAPTTEENTSSTEPSSAVGVIHGVFPFPPPARDSPFSPPSSSPRWSVSSMRPEVSSEYSDREKMEGTNAWFLQGHFHQMVILMNKKFQDLLDYDKTKNRKILHIDWVAGNPKDPARIEGSESAASGGMSAEDRRLSETVARIAMRATHGIKQWDETETWNKAMFFGDWLNDDKGFRQFYLEIQVKRISGADEALLERCGISPELVWLPLHNDKAETIMPVVLPPLVSRPLPSQAGPRELPDPHASASEDGPEVEEAEYATPAPASSMQVPTSSADKGKGIAVAPHDQAGEDKTAAPRPGMEIPREPVVVSSESARAPLPDLGNLALQAHGEGAAPSISRAPADTSASAAAPRTGIPRSQPFPVTGSFNSLEQAAAAPASGSPTTTASSGTSDESFYEDEGTIYLAEGADPFEALIPAHQSQAISAADLARQREEFDRNAVAKRAELQRLFAFRQDPAFIARMKKSFVYAVRVVAVPERTAVTNVFTGPPVEDRYGTLLAQGGWVVPPVEEREKHREAHKRAYRGKGAKPGRYEGLPRPQVQHALPMRLDWSGGMDPRYFGPPPPLWRELCEPCLEDVYWMVWQLLGGRQFLGFTPGAGFGVQRRDPEGDPVALGQCPFKSPSTEALYHAASYPRDDETKKN